jgi:pyruvate kinase
VTRKTKIVCTIGPSTNTKEMIWQLAEAGMNVARLNMSHGDHASHQKVIDLVKEYNAQSKDNVIAIMLDTKVLSYALTCFYLVHLDLSFLLIVLLSFLFDGMNCQSKN